MFYNPLWLRTQTKRKGGGGGGWRGASLRAVTQTQWRTETEHALPRISFVCRRYNLFMFVFISFFVPEIAIFAPEQTWITAFRFSINLQFIFFALIFIKYA